MAATTVRAGTVEVVVTNVPKRFFPLWEGAVTITRTDFVGLTVASVVERVEGMLRRGIARGYYTLNGGVIDGKRILQPGDKLKLRDP